MSTQPDLKVKGGFLPHTFPVAAKVYILAVIAVGLSVFLYSAYLSLIHPDSRWLYLAGLTILASCLAVKIPLIKGNTSLSITISDVFIFAAILVFGPAVAVVIAVLEGFITNFRVGNKRLYKHLFNLGLLALVAFTVSQVFYVIVGKTAPLDPIGPQDLGRLLMNGGICALLYFVLNSSTVALAIALASRQSWVTVWTQNFLWTSPANFVNALCALIVFMSFTQGGFPVAAVVVLPAMVVYGAHRLSTLRIKQNAAVTR